MNSTYDDDSDKYVIINAISVFMCLLATILVFVLRLHNKIVYRLALYQVLAGLIIALAQLFQVFIGNSKYDQECVALGWFGMYFQWVKLFFTVWITFHLFCFAILHKNLRKLEVLYVVSSLLVPILIAAVPLITHSYGYSSVDGCYIPAYAGNVTLYDAIIERFALWDGPAMVILLALSITMAVMVIKLGGRVYRRLKYEYEPITDGDQFSKALKQLLPLAAFPILFLLFIVPVFIYDVYYSFVTPSPNENLILTADIFIFLWNMTSGLTLIVHISVARVPVCIRRLRLVQKKKPISVSSFLDVTNGKAFGSRISPPMNSATSFPLPEESIAYSY